MRTSVTRSMRPIRYGSGRITKEEMKHCKLNGSAATCLSESVLLGFRKPPTTYLREKPRLKDVSPVDRDFTPLRGFGGGRSVPTGSRTHPWLYADIPFGGWLAAVARLGFITTMT